MMATYLQWEGALSPIMPTKADKARKFEGRRRIGLAGTGAKSQLRPDGHGLASTRRESEVLRTGFVHKISIA